MSEARKPGTDTEAWFKDLGNRLERAGSLLGDAALHAARSTRRSGNIDRQLSVVQELVAAIENRVAALFGEGSDEPTSTHPDAPEDEVDFREVPGFPGYRVGSDGRVWGSRRAGRGYGLTREWRVLKPYLLRPGPTFTVSLYRERERHALRVDGVVLLAFVGPCPQGFEVEHANGDPLDNRLDNLRYVPSRPEREELMADAALIGGRNNKKY